MNCFLSQSSLGKKLVMSITGCFLVLFILFHMSMNLTAIISPEGYNMICELLGANWYALAGTAVLALGVVVHFCYALVLTMNNYKARGKERYAVTVVEPGVAWASKNMLALGWIILGGLLLHLINFWSKMQLVEFLRATVSERRLGQRHVVSAPEVRGQHRGYPHLPGLRRRGGGLLPPERLPLLRRRLLINVER